jgi:thiol:disulfide interchange protein DsbD
VLWALVFATIGMYLLTGLLGKSLGELDAFLPAGSTTIVATTHTSTNIAETQWLTNYEDAISLGKETGMPVFVDFTGHSCTNCK